MEQIDPRKLPATPELMIAGPGELHEDDLAALGHQVLAHYGDLWTQVMNETVALMGELLGAEKPYIMPGTGTVCLDAAFFNLFEPGQRVVIANTGFFGMRLMEIARSHRLEVIEVPVEVGLPADVAEIAAAAAGADGVATVHVETATGVRHPIADIAEALRGTGAVYLVDGIASAGGEVLDVEGMGLHALVTASQKGLEGPPGLGIVALSAAGRERMAARTERPQSWYLDLETWDRYRKDWGSWHPHPVTMPTNLVLAQAASLRRILEAGLEGYIERRAKLAARCRDGLRDLGLEPIPREGCEANLVVAAWSEDPAALVKHVAEHQGIAISGGLAPTVGKAIRIGLMGRTATDEMVERVLDGIRKGLKAADGRSSPG
jgi:alanine-glyoxylate transaminase/serine-glyoxylate transaminase/serine-pyruvate transaminase